MRGFGLYDRSVSGCRKTAGAYRGRLGKLRGDMGEKWPKIGHIPPHFYFGAHIPPHFSGSRWARGVVSSQFSVYRLLFRASVLLRAPGIVFLLGLYDKRRCGHFCGGVRLRGDYKGMSTGGRNRRRGDGIRLHSVTV